MITNTLSAGLEGVRNGTNGMQDAASRIARAGTGLDQPTGQVPRGTESPATQGGFGGLLEPIVDLTVSQRLTEASLVVVSTADEMLGTLIDEKA